MPKINCSITENFLRELGKVTNNCTKSCTDCVIFSCKLAHPHDTCVTILTAYPQEVIPLIQNWSDAHPVKCRLDDLLEKFPDFKTVNGYPTYFPVTFGYCKNCKNCPNLRNSSHETCWNEPLEGGATGEE